MLDGAALFFSVNPAIRADVRLEIDWADHLALPLRKPVFDSGGLWALFEEAGGYRFYFSTKVLGSIPYKAAWFDRTFSRGEIVLYRPYFDPDLPVNPVEYPLDELLAIHRLALGEGVEVHGLGVVDERNRGHLFVGHSGAGKSTSARLWQQRRGARVLSDDRIILRIENGRPRMYGTPWHGDAGIALPESADLSHIYVLQHGHQNRLTPLSPGRAAAEVVSRSFIPYHSREGLDFTLRLLEKIASAVQGSLFQFVPDETAVEAICHG